MFENISTWFVALPIGACLGWVADRLLGPTADAFGAGLLNVFSRWWNKKSEAITDYHKLEDLVRKNHMSNGHGRFNEQKTYMHDREINLTLLKYGSFIRRAIKEAWIESATINNYDESDIFFAGMNLLFPQLGKSDISTIYEKFKDNNQASLRWWLEQMEERKPKFLSLDVLKYLRTEQEERNKII